MPTTPLLNDCFLRKVAKTAGRSNTTSVPKEEKLRVQAAIAQIQEQLRCTNLTLHSEQVKSDLLELQGQLAIAIAPHKQLPAELIARAFMEFAEDYIDVMFWDYCKLRKLREICSHWRQIALDQHLLWSRIRIVWPPITSSYPPQLVPVSWNALVDKATSILPRTGPVAIELMTEVHPSVNLRFNLPEIDAVSALILPYSQQLYDLQWRCGQGELRKLFKIPGTTFPLLKSLALGSQAVGGNSPESTDTPAGTVIDIIDHSPSLQNLAIAVTHFEWLPSSAACSKLTYLQIDEPVAPDALLFTLSNCGKLQDLVAALSPTVPQLLSAINLPYLKNMQLCVNTSNETFLDRLYLPMLSSLSLHSPTSPPIHKILTLVSRSSCSIETFIDKCNPTPDAPVSSEEYQRLLSKMPRLRELTTEMSVDEALVQQVGAGALTPYLEVFNCNSFLDTVTFIDAVEAGLRSRSSEAPPKTCLRYIRMLKCPGIGCDRPTYLKRTGKLEKQHGIKMMTFAPIDLSAINFDTF